MDALVQLLSSRVKAEVFRLLFGLEAGEMHVREIERRSGLSVSTVRQELRRLSQLGLVAARKDGNRTYYHANRGHPCYADIRGLVLKTSGLVAVLRSALAQPSVRVAFVFGSVASGTAHAQSDVDLMVIGTSSLRTVGKMLSETSAQLGREVNPHVLTPAEFARRRDARDHFVCQVLDSPRLFVVGDDDELAAMGG
jgi:DNA-binding transcriptional ArsR family regulator